MSATHVPSDPRLVGFNLPPEADLRFLENTIHQLMASLRLVGYVDDELELAMTPQTFETFERLFPLPTPAVVQRTEFVRFRRGELRLALDPHLPEQAAFIRRRTPKEPPQ